MSELHCYSEELKTQGFTIIEKVFLEEQIERILQVIDQADTSRKTFRKSADLFAIRQFVREIPEINELVFNEEFKDLIGNLFGKDYFVVKSIYFDKPEQSNWFVSYHQDLTISVDKKVDLEGYKMWTVKQDQFAVQPPIDILENIYTVRIHLDDTDENNGALKVIEGSHLKDIYRPEDINWGTETEAICRVSKGGIIIMKPLILHSSGRTINNNKRRVIHIEFANRALPQELNWAEQMDLP